MSDKLTAISRATDAYYDGWEAANYNAERRLRILAQASADLNVSGGAPEDRARDVVKMARIYEEYVNQAPGMVSLEPTNG